MLADVKLRENDFGIRPKRHGTQESETTTSKFQADKSGTSIEQSAFVQRSLWGALVALVICFLWLFIRKCGIFR